MDSQFSKPTARPCDTAKALEIDFDERGPKFGSLYLLQKTGLLFDVLPRDRLEGALSERFGGAFDVTRTIAGLAVVARALNKGDLALAAIATSHLHRPKPAFPLDVFKASPDDPVRPGWPTGTAGGRGGKFRPKDASIALDPKMEAERLARIERLNARRGVRAMLRRVLTAKRLARLVLEGAAEAVPVLDVVDSAALIEDLAEIAAEMTEENADIDAAKAFAEYGPHTLEELSVSAENESFSSFDAFKKGDLDKRFGLAGDGYEYHHIVEQGSGLGSIPESQLQSTSNIVRIPKILHEEINAMYSRLESGTGATFRKRHGCDVARNIENNFLRGTEDRWAACVATNRSALSMIDAGLAETVSTALDTFMKGAKTLHLGYYLDNRLLERQGLRTISESLKVIDALSPTGRDVLLPLLDQADEGIRVTAACGLWQSHPDIVIPLLEEMERLSITEAGQTAMITLMTKGRHNPCVSNPRYPCLYGDETNPNRWRDDPDYQAAIMSNPGEH